MRFAVLLGAVVAVSAAVLPGNTTRACLCREGEKSASKVAANRDAVFEGDVVALKLLEVPGPGGGTFIRKVSATLRVVQAWKGIDRDLVTLQTGSGMGDCGYDFRLQGRYLIFAMRDTDGQLYTSVCDRTAPITEATKSVRELGPPIREFEFRRLEAE